MAIPPASSGNPSTVGYVIASDSYVTYQLTVIQAGNYAVTLNYSSPGGFAWGNNTGVNLLVNSASVGSVTFSPTGSYTTYVNASPVVIALRAGGVNFTIQAQYAGFNIGGITFTPTSPAAAVAPSIITQPASQTITSGQTATFSVAASGTAPLTYQWQLNGSPIGGATSSSYTTAAEAASSTGSQFSVVGSNSAGSATSGNATLTVNAAAVAPSITTQPASQTIISGQTATFLVAASGTAPLTYQWQLNGSSIGGATSASYTTPAEVTSNSGAQCSVVASNSAGSVASHMGKILAKVQRYKTAYGDLLFGGPDGQVYF